MWLLLMTLSIGAQAQQQTASQKKAKQIFDNVLENKATRAQTDVVVANAACGISLMNPNLPITDTVAMARESLESGKALACLKKFIDINS